LGERWVLHSIKPFPQTVRIYARRVST